MSDMQTAIVRTLQNEGGYVDNPDDLGGPTNMGITQADMPGVNLQTLTQAQAVSYYAANFWKDWMGEINSQVVVNKLFDMGVLLSVDTAVRMLQRALGFATAQQDGDFGPETLAATNEAGDGLLAEYKQVLAAHMEWIVSQNASQEEFLQGWLDRVES